MKVGICVPCFGDCAGRIKPLLETIKRFTVGYDYKVFVRDDCTPDQEAVVLTQTVTERGGATFLRGEEWGFYWKNFHELGWHAVNQGCDLITFINDDCLASAGWLTAIVHFFQWNETLKPGMVSGTMIEAWELAMDGRLKRDVDFYNEDYNSWSSNGAVLREHINFSQEAFALGKKEDRIQTVGSYTPIGHIADGRFRLEHPVPLSGGLGPCFTVNAEAWKAVDGMSKCEFVADFEAMLGFKCWDAGYICCTIPSAPVYHARGMSTKEGIGGADRGGVHSLEETEAYKPWTPLGQQRFAKMWGFINMQEALKHYEVKYQNPASEKLARSRFIKYQSNKFPVNTEYERLTDINLGTIDWVDPKQTVRMTWIAEHCIGSVLDVGCANGGLLSFLQVKKHEGPYTGIDLDRIRIDEAKRSVADGRFYVLDAVYGLPFHDREFTTVTCAEMLEHIPRDLVPNVLQDLCRVASDRVLLTLPEDEQYQVNVDHVWEVSMDRVQEFLNPFTNGWRFACYVVDGFLLVEMRRCSIEG